MPDPRTLPPVNVPEWPGQGDTPIIDYDEAAGPVPVEKLPPERNKPRQRVYNVQTASVAKGTQAVITEWAAADYWEVYIVGGATGDILYVRPGDSPAVGANEAICTGTNSLRLPFLRHGTGSGQLQVLAPSTNTNTVTVVAIACAGYDVAVRT